jgi:hypothetical protein
MCDQVQSQPTGVPPLAGLCSMQRAISTHWSVEESVDRLKRLHYVLRRLCEAFTVRIPSEPLYELKTAFSYHAYICAEQVELIRRRVAEMREPPLGLEHVPHVGLKQLMDEIQFAPSSGEFVMGCYEVALPAIVDGCSRLIGDAHPLADAPTVRIGRLIRFELQDVVDFGVQAIDGLVSAEQRAAMRSWTDMLQDCLECAGRVDGTADAAASLPPARYAAVAQPLDMRPKRDSRFQDPYNAGVNPEAFLYDPRFTPRDKTLMMYYKRLRELDVPEMMASILSEIGHDEPWPFHYEMTRQLWDEARHAMMGEVGFESLGIDWTKIPINFTWSLNLNTQLDARERHGVLFFIEQGLMPRTGKRYEWEVAMESGDRLSGMFQDFDWADEVLHAQIGRRWYVPRFSSLQEALRYGDACWSRVLSHWRAYREQGLTEHRNWWPDLYRDACHRWGVEPKPDALAFCETYESSRADLRDIDTV